MPLWKNGQFVEDAWQVAADNSPLPDGVPAFVGLKRWREERGVLEARNAPVGLVLAPGSNWTDIAGDLSRFPAIAVTIPKYADGRAFSIARLLRERDGYKGEIRAVGDYIIDQVPFMLRVGIDAFQTENPTLIKAFEKGLWPEVKEYLQPAWSGDGEVPAGTRPWTRRSSGKPE